MRISGNDKQIVAVNPTGAPIIRGISGRNMLWERIDIFKGPHKRNIRLEPEDFHLE